MRVIGFFRSAGIRRHLRLAIPGLLFLTFGYAGNTVAQKQKPPGSQGQERKLDEQSQEQPDDVVRIRTDLVQTSLSVFDKRGKFVDNLRAEDFELNVDGKPYPVLFFDRVINGVAGESPRAAGPGNSLRPPISSPTDGTRTVLFFVDDLHLSPEGTSRARRMLANYIEQEMGANDQVAIAAASGQIGFLQQVTSERAVLQAAVERLKNRPTNVIDTDRPRMSVFQALAIERNDADVLTYFEEVLLRDILAGMVRANPQAARDMAERLTRSRASRLIRQSDDSAKQTLLSLDSAVRSAAQVPGRKLFVFLSDGFLVNNQNPDIRYKLQRITDAAVRAGAVLYTIQVSGLTTTFADASSDVILIPGTGTGQLAGEDTAMQEPLTELAADTGGHALLNANDLNGSMKHALQESNDYYLLAWRPEAEGFRGKEFHRLEVRVKGRTDLSVLVQRGLFGDGEATAVAPAKAKRSKTVAAALGEDPASNGLQSGFLQTNLLASYLDVPNHGPRLSVLMQVKQANESAKNDKLGTIDVAGVIYNESGKEVGRFVENLRPETNSESQDNVTYLNQFDVKPGLYQVRVAARDTAGVIGRAMQWVTVPDLALHHLALSSLLIGERDLASTPNRSNATQIQKAQLKIDRRFVQNSRLRVLTFVYNAGHDAANQFPKLSARIDLFHGNKVVVSTPTFAIETANAEDPARIPYAGELNLASLPKGHYRIRLTVIDLSAKAFASQEATFEIE